jgi:hypothetical protein
MTSHYWDLGKSGGGHLCEILKRFAEVCDICPDLGVGYKAAMGHFAAEYGNINMTELTFM